MSWRFTDSNESIVKSFRELGWDYEQLQLLYLLLDSMTVIKRLNKRGRLIKQLRYTHKNKKYYAPTR